MKQTYRKVILIKLNTLDDAQYPQRDKYPDGFTKEGLVLENSIEINTPLLLYTKLPNGAIIPMFTTSRIQEISEISVPDNLIVFTTRNSNYKLIIEQKAHSLICDKHNKE